jgi:hypothetical protein
MEYVIVEFPELREVFMGGVSQGNNLNDAGGHRILRVDTGMHTFTLGGPKDFDPDSQLVDVSGTTPVLPKPIVFTKKV